MPAGRLAIAVLLLTTVAAAGCSSVDSAAAPIGEIHPPRASGHPIDIYVDPSSPANLLEGFGLTLPPAEMPGDAVRIGRIDVAGDNSWQGIADEAKKRARQLGADAIVIGDYYEGPNRDSNGLRFEPAYFRSIAASAYRYREQDAVPARR